MGVRSCVVHLHRSPSESRSPNTSTGVLPNAWTPVPFPRVFIEEKHCNTHLTQPHLNPGSPIQIRTNYGSLFSQKEGSAPQLLLHHHRPSGTDRL